MLRTVGWARRSVPTTLTSANGRWARREVRLCPPYEDLPLRLQPLRRLRREVGEDAVGAGALEGEQAFHDRAVAVDPAIAGGGCDHRVFAGHLIDEGRHRESV